MPSLCRSRSLASCVLNGKEEKFNECIYSITINRRRRPLQVFGMFPVWDWERAASCLRHTVCRRMMLSWNLEFIVSEFVRSHTLASALAHCHTPITY
jgi:hypothetical protein